MHISTGRHSAVRLLLLGALAGAAGCDSVGPAPKVSDLQPASGNEQRDTARAALRAPVVVRAVAAGGGGVKGKEVLFRAGHGGSVTPESGTTDAEGRVQVSWTLGPQAGAQTLSARLADDPTKAIVFTATAEAGALAGVEVVDGDAQNAMAGRALPRPVVFRARDANGNEKGGVPVAFTVVRGGGTLSTASASTGPDGRVSAGWTLGTQTVDQRIGASAGGFTATAVAAVDTTRAVYLVLPDSAAVGDTVAVRVRINLVNAGSQRRGAIQAALNWNGAGLRFLRFTARDALEHGSAFAPGAAGGAGPVTVLLSRARNDLAAETVFTMLFLVTSRTAPGDVPVTLSLASLVGAGSFDDLLPQVSVVGGVIRIR